MSINGKPADTEDQVRSLKDFDLHMLAHAGGGSARVPAMMAQAVIAERARKDARLALTVAVIGALASIIAAISSIAALHRL